MNGSTANGGGVRSGSTDMNASVLLALARSDRPEIQKLFTDTVVRVLSSLPAFADTTSSEGADSAQLSAIFDWISTQQQSFTHTSSALDEKSSPVSGGSGAGFDLLSLSAVVRGSFTDLYALLCSPPQPTQPTAHRFESSQSVLGLAIQKLTAAADSIAPAANSDPSFYPTTHILDRFSTEDGDAVEFAVQRPEAEAASPLDSISSICVDTTNRRVLLWSGSDDRIDVFSSELSAGSTLLPSSFIGSVSTKPSGTEAVSVTRQRSDYESYGWPKAPARIRMVVVRDTIIVMYVVYWLIVCCASCAVFVWMVDGIGLVSCLTCLYFCWCVAAVANPEHHTFGHSTPKHSLPNQFRSRYFHRELTTNLMLKRRVSAVPRIWSRPIPNLLRSARCFLIRKHERFRFSRFSQKSRVPHQHRLACIMQCVSSATD